VDEAQEALASLAGLAVLAAVPVPTSLAAALEQETKADSLQ
jgi:hypothetical protein